MYYSTSLGGFYLDSGEIIILKNPLRKKRIFKLINQVLKRRNGISSWCNRRPVNFIEVLESEENV
jgi:hypothetical protein